MIKEELLKADKLIKQKNFDEALIILEKLQKREPSNFLILAKIGLIYQLKNKFHKAIELYEKALSLSPENKDILINLGSIYSYLNKFHKAIECFKKDLSSYESLFNLGIMFEKIGKIKEARNCYYNAIKLKPEKKFPLMTKISFLMPPIYNSKEEILNYRKRISDFIDRHNDSKEVIKNPISDIGITTFYLGYHGLCNKEINKKIAEFYKNHINKNLIKECAHKKNNKIKIGFISSYFRKHSVSDVSNGWIAKLNNKYFEKIIFSIGEIKDKSTKLLENNCSKIYFLPYNIEIIQRTVLNENLDILFFTDIGMEPMTYFLAFSKLAPIQITYPGHPDTTGIDTIDYYISSKFWENENSKTHYSEKLIEVNSLTWYYFKPKFQKLNLDKKFFGFSEKDNIYCINQSLFKIHPDFDLILDKILKNDKNGKIAIFYDETFYWWKDFLLKRFENTIFNLDRIKFIPKLKFDYYINFLKISDVVLDTLYFNGGTTSLQTLYVGTPIVTMPTELMRGRFTYGMYKKMGIDGLIGNNIENYVKIAIDIANNKEKQNKLRKIILKSKDILFEDENVVKDFEEIFLSLV